jgi:hypothetical protein
MLGRNSRLPFGCMVLFIHSFIHDIPLRAIPTACMRACGHCVAVRPRLLAPSYLS